MKWDVISVHPEAPLTLRVAFADGLSGLIRFKESHLTGVFEILKNPALFSQAHAEAGAIAWPGDLDLAPDAAYAEIKAHGEWVLA